MGFNLSSIWYTRRLTWFQIMKCRNLDINPKFKLILTAIRATYSCQWVIICRSDQFDVNQRPFIPRTQLQIKLRVNTPISKTLSERKANGSCRTEIARPKGTVICIFGMQKEWVFRVALNWPTGQLANWPRLNMTVHQKFRNIAFHCPFTNA